MFWGLTPALDLTEQVDKYVDTPPEELNILIVGGADCRHVIKTLARSYRNKKVKLKFFLMEGCIETLAKQLLLLFVALQPQEVLGLVQKTRIFMELYGNSLVRPCVAKYLASTAAELVKMVTNYDYLNELMPNVSIDIKYKERDYLENVLKFWCSADEFDICHSWDVRLRKSLGARFDSKIGVFDWDLHMRFHAVGGNQVCNQEYKNFRLIGVPFSWLESEVSKPNRSLVCGVIQNGEKLAHYGYLGDMQTGPFVTYGLECEDKAFLKSTNGQNAFRATDVTERNLMQMFHEIEYQNEYEHKTMNDFQLGPVTMQESLKKVVDFRAICASKRKAQRCLHLENVEIKFLSISDLNLMKRKEKYKNFYNLLYFGSTYLKYVEKELLDNISAKNALILIENQRYILHFRDKDLETFSGQLKEKFTDIKLDEICFDVKKDDYARFIVNI